MPLHGTAFFSSKKKAARSSKRWYVPDYMVAVAKNTVVSIFLSPVTLTVKFSTNILIYFGGNNLRNILQMARQIKWIGTNKF